MADEPKTEEKELMENKEKAVTPTELEEVEKVEKTLTQKEVDELIIERVKRERDKFAKDLGIGEDFNKEEYKKYKEFIDNQKSASEKLMEENAKLKQEKELALLEVRNSKIERTTEEVLKELEVDTKYVKTILKLANVDVEEISRETLKPIIEKVIEEELPMLINNEKIKIGVDKPEDKKIVSGTKDYLDKKYANNPYYNK
jgi:hypothetical protein